MLRNSSMSSVSLDDLASFSATPPNIRTSSNTHQLSSASAAAASASLAADLSSPSASSSLSRRARVAKSAVLSLTIEHSRLLAMLASVESMVNSASSTSSAPTSAHFTNSQQHPPNPHPQPHPHPHASHLPMEEPTRVQQLAAMYERQEKDARRHP